MSGLRANGVWAVFSTFLFAVVSRADFNPPKDGKFTEKQLTAFIAISKAQMDALKAASNAGAGTSSGAAGIALYEHASAKIDASYAQNGMSKEEFSWMNEKVTKLWPIAAFQKQWEDNGKPDLEKQIKVRSDESTAAKSKLDTYEQAQKTGTRVMTKEQRDSAVASATSDRDSIAGEVKTDEDALKPINDEITQHDKDASDAEALAKSPPRRHLPRRSQRLYRSEEKRSPDRPRCRQGRPRSAERSPEKSRRRQGPSRDRQRKNRPPGNSRDRRREEPGEVRQRSGNH